MQLIKQFLKLKYCDIWRFKQWAPFVFKMRQILLPLFKTGVFSRCVTHRYPRSVCDCCDQAMRNSQFLASHLVSTVTLWAWAREACVASKQTHEAGGGWVREGERVFQNRAVCGLTVHNLFICAHERKSERGERKARPHPLPPTPYSVKFSVLHWRPVLSRCFPRGKRCLPRPSIRPTTLRRFVFSRSNLRPCYAGKGAGCPCVTRYTEVHAKRCPVWHRSQQRWCYFVYVTPRPGKDVLPVFMYT